MGQTGLRNWRLRHGRFATPSFPSSRSRRTQLIGAAEVLSGQLASTFRAHLGQHCDLDGVSKTLHGREPVDVMLLSENLHACVMLRRADVRGEETRRLGDWRELQLVPALDHDGDGAEGLVHLGVVAELQGVRLRPSV